MIQHTQKEFEAELARGRVYEVAFSRWLQAEREYYTLPAFDFSGIRNRCVPQITGKHRGALTAPDILACCKGTWAWFEVKLKDYAPLYRKTNTLVTGLPLRNWQHYLAVREETLTPVWIVFVHLKEREVVAGEIKEMSEDNIDHRATMNSGGMVFFEYKKLHRLMSLSKLDGYKEVADNVMTLERG